MRTSCRLSFAPHTIVEASMGKHNDNLIWLDLEMTGLDPERDTIIEIATLVTDRELNILAEWPGYAIRQPLLRLEAMDEWNRNQHQNFGLLQRVLESPHDTRVARSRTLDVLAH